MTDISEALEVLNGFYDDEYWDANEGEFIHTISYELDNHQAAAIQQLIVDMHAAHEATETENAELKKQGSRLLEYADMYLNIDSNWFFELEALFNED